MQSTKTNQSIFIITGMHRSGTSLAASLLQSAGMDIGQRLLGPSDSNVKGHFEELDFMEFHADVLHSQGISIAGWSLKKEIQVQEQYLDRAKAIIEKNLSKPVCGWKDPRTTLFLKFWSDLLPSAKFLFVYRSPWEVIDSLYRRCNEYDKTFLCNPNFAVQVWVNYNQAILDFYEKFPDKCIIFDNCSITHDPCILVKAIKEKYEINLSYPDLSVYDNSLLHGFASSSHRPALIKHHFSEAFTLYNKLNSNAFRVDTSSNFSWFEPTQVPPYEVWALQDWLDIRKLERQELTLNTELDKTQFQLQQTQVELERSQLYVQEAFENIQTEREQCKSQLQQNQVELEQSQAELERSQFYLQETFVNIQTEREQYKSQLRQIRLELEQLRNEDIRALLRRIKNKLRNKYTHLLFTTKLEKIISLTKRFQNKIKREKKDLSPELPDKCSPVYSNIDCKEFWRLIDPVIQEKSIYFKKEAPRISILTPTWNSSLDWFIETALSVFNQSISDWEWCIVDDGSTSSEIRSILADLAHKDPRIKVSLQESGGISSATNRALHIAIGDYICFLDHDDTLVSTALEENINKLSEGFDVVYSDEDKLDFSGFYVEPFFKPDWSLEYFRGVMYVGHLLCVRRNLAIAVGALKSEYDGIQDYEFMLRISEVTNSIGHIPKILYHWRKVNGSIAADVNAKPGIDKLQQTAVNAHLERVGLPAKAEASLGNHRLKIVPLPKTHNPLISIIIPTKDAPQYLEKCLKSIFALSTYQNYEVILVDNETTDPEALRIIKQFPVKRLHFLSPFNYSRANNLGAKYAQGDYLVFLNNDAEVITEDWLQHLLYYAEQPDVGAVGALLLFPDRTVQHAGVVMGFRGTADHLMRGFPSNVDGYAGSLVCAREVSAITAACMMVKKSQFNNIGCLNEHFFTHYQDVDLCMRFIESGKKIIFNPRVVLLHYESKTRKEFYDVVDRMLLLEQWQNYIDKGDPFYNPNLDLAYSDYTIRAQRC